MYHFCVHIVSGYKICIISVYNTLVIGTIYILDFERSYIEKGITFYCNLLYATYISP